MAIIISIFYIFANMKQEKLPIAFLNIFNSHEWRFKKSLPWYRSGQSKGYYLMYKIYRDQWRLSTSIATSLAHILVHKYGGDTFYPPPPPRDVGGGGLEAGCLYPPCFMLAINWWN